MLPPKMLPGKVQARMQCGEEGPLDHFPSVPHSEMGWPSIIKPVWQWYSARSPTRALPPSCTSSSSLCLRVLFLLLGTSTKCPFSGVSGHGHWTRKQRGGSDTDLMEKKDSQNIASEYDKQGWPFPIWPALCLRRSLEHMSRRAGKGDLVAGAIAVHIHRQLRRRVSGDGLGAHYGQAGRRWVAPPTWWEALKRRVTNQAVAIGAGKVDLVVELSHPGIWDSHPRRCHKLRTFTLQLRK